MHVWVRFQLFVNDALFLTVFVNIITHYYLRSRNKLLLHLNLAEYGTVFYFELSDEVTFSQTIQSYNIYVALGTGIFNIRFIQ